MKAHLFFSILLSFLFSSCYSQKSINNQECIHHIKTFLLRTDNGDSLALKCYQYKDKGRNVICFLYEFQDKGFLQGGIIFPFSEIKDSIRVLNLDNKPPREFVLEISHIGSTYGAKSHIVIWQNKNGNWNLTKDNVLRGYFIDSNKDGRYELVNYLGDNKNKDVYIFKSGKFIKRK